MEFMRLGLQARGKQGSVTVHKVRLCPLVALILLQVLRAYREVSGLTVWMEMGKSSHCSKTMPVRVLVVLGPSPLLRVPVGHWVELQPPR